MFLSTEVVQRIFIVANVEVAGTLSDEVSEVNDSATLMRHEMVEAVVRLADAKYGISAAADAAVASGAPVAASMIAEPLYQLGEVHLAHLPLEATVDNDVYRSRRLYTRSVDVALKRQISDSHTLAVSRPIVSRDGS